MPIFDGSRDINDPWKQSIVERARCDGLTHFRIAQRIVGDRAEAEDICQHAYLKALTAQDTIRDPDKLTGWLTRVIVNQSLDILRKRKRHRDAKEEHHAIAWQKANANNPHELADNREYVASMLERLDEPVRTVVVMRTMQGLSGNEVMQALGCSAALVSIRLHQGLEQLRQWMMEDDGKETK